MSVSGDEDQDLLALAALGFGGKRAGSSASDDPGCPAEEEHQDERLAEPAGEASQQQGKAKKKKKKKGNAAAAAPVESSTTATASRTSNTTSSSGSSGKGASTSSTPGFPISDAEEREVKHLLNQVDFIKRIGPYTYEIKPGHVKGMNVPARFFASPKLLQLITDEVQTSGGSFAASVQQLANVATLPGVVMASLGMPDLHSGYGFAIGNVAAVDMAAPQAVVSPGGVGFDVNCGVRLLRSNLHVSQLLPVKDQLADALFRAVPVGVGSEGSLRLSQTEMDKLLEQGMKYTEDKGLSWPEDREVTEEGGCFQGAKAAAVSARAKVRGQAQCGTLGSGNHYCEVQVVEEVYDAKAAAAMGLEKPGTIAVMIHSGSRGLGHQVCTDYLSACDRCQGRLSFKLVDRQLACVPIASQEGKDYLAAMAAAANYAFANRALMAHQARGAFSQVFGKSARDLGLQQVYDVAHNIAKVEEHTLPDGRVAHVLVHRKGATRSFPPGHPAVPEVYREVGQPVLIGGSMGSSSFVLTGGPESMKLSFGSTCHGAGRALSRSKALREIDSKQVLRELAVSGITTRIATKRLAAEEATESYKDVEQVVHTCHAVGLSRLCVKLRPLIVVKG